MYTTSGEKLSWREFKEKRANGEKIYVGDYPKKDKDDFKHFAHHHTMAETKTWLTERDFNLDIMYTKGRPDCYDEWSGECAGIHCKDGILWN